MRTSRLLDSREIARRFDLPESWIISQVEAGRIKALRLGRRHFRFVEATVARALERMAREGLQFPRPDSLDPIREGGRDAR